MKGKDVMWLVVSIVMALGSYLQPALNPTPTDAGGWIQLVIGGLLVVGGLLRAWMTNTPASAQLAAEDAAARQYAPAPRRGEQMPRSADPARTGK